LYLVETGDRAVEQIIHKSFKETMLDIENRMETRVRGKGEDGQVRNEERITGNLIYASFVHGIDGCYVRQMRTQVLDGRASENAF
jgi:hypothetical protein